MIRTILNTAAAALAACTLGIAAPAPAGAEPLAKDVFGAQRVPNGGPSQPIGFYSRGCASGNVQMPESGPTWQVMRLSRNRNWGQPQLVAFLQDLSRTATRIGWGGLYIGDMSQPMGGPMITGHASHQIGLDADIWMLPPSSLRLSAGEREKISSVSITDGRGVQPSAYWSASHAALLQAAAMDPRVDRVFVDPVAKVQMCRSGARGAWLQKIRPINAHNFHFHVRLKCPAGSAACQVQTPPVAALSGSDDGCAEAAKWVQDRVNPPPAPPKDPDYRHPRSYRLSEMPRACQALVTR